MINFNTICQKFDYAASGIGREKRRRKYGSRHLPIYKKGVKNANKLI